MQPSAKMEMPLSHLICYGAKIRANFNLTTQNTYIRYMIIILFDAMIEK